MSSNNSKIKRKQRSSSAEYPGHCKKRKQSESFGKKLYLKGRERKLESVLYCKRSKSTSLCGMPENNLYLVKSIIMCKDQGRHSRLSNTKDLTKHMQEREGLIEKDTRSSCLAPSSIFSRPGDAKSGNLFEFRDRGNANILAKTHSSIRQILLNQRDTFRLFSLKLTQALV